MEILINTLPMARLHVFAAVFLCVLIATLVAVLLDLRDGLQTARILAQPIRSNRLRVTIGKIVEYWQFIILVVVADVVGAFLPFYALPYLTLLFGVAVIFIEGKSMLEHAKRRKTGSAKLPEALHDIADFVGGIDELRSLLSDMAHRSLEKATADPPEKTVE